MAHDMHGGRCYIGEGESIRNTVASMSFLAHDLNFMEWTG